MSVDPQDPKLNPPAPGEGDPPGDGAGNSDPPGSGDDGAQGDEPQDVEGYKALITKLRGESRTATRDAAAAKKAQTAAVEALKLKEDAEKSDSEKLAAKLKETEEKAAKLERDARTKALRYSVADAARTLGVINPDHLSRLLDLDDVEFDDAGEPVGISDLVKAFVALPENKYLVGEAGAPKVPGPPATEKPTRNGAGPTPEEERALQEAAASRFQSRF